MRLQCILSVLFYKSFGVNSLFVNMTWENPISFFCEKPIFFHLHRKVKRIAMQIYDWVCVKMQCTRKSQNIKKANKGSIKWERWTCVVTYWFKKIMHISTFLLYNQFEIFCSHDLISWWGILLLRWSGISFLIEKPKI